MSNIAEVRKVFRSSKLGQIAGCFVVEGAIRKGAHVCVIRGTGTDARVVWDGTLKDLRRFKDDVSEVRENFECGIRLPGCDLQEGDRIAEVDPVALGLPPQNEKASAAWLKAVKADFDIEGGDPFTRGWEASRAYFHFADDLGEGAAQENQPTKEVGMPEPMISFEFYTHGLDSEGKLQHLTHTIRTWKPVALALARQVYSMPHAHERISIDGTFVDGLSEEDRAFVVGDDA